MNFSGYLCLVAATVLVVLAQQSDAQSSNNGAGNNRANATLKAIKESSQKTKEAGVKCDAVVYLEMDYNNGTNYIIKARKTILDAINRAINQASSSGDFEGAKKVIQQGFAEARASVFNSGGPFFKSYGGAKDLAPNANSTQLQASSQLVQRAGVAILDILNIAENLLIQGISAGGKAVNVLLKTLRIIVEAAFAASFNNIQKSIQIADQALNPTRQGQVENLNCESAASKDPEGSDAVKEINDAANKALQRGANADLVEKLRQVSICSIGKLVNILADGVNNIDDIKRTAGTDPSAVAAAFNKKAEPLINGIHAIAAKLYFVIAKLAHASGNQLNIKIDQAIAAAELGKVEILSGSDYARDVIFNGMKYGGDAPNLAFDAAISTAQYGKLAYFEAMVKCAKLTLSVL